MQNRIARLGVDPVISCQMRDALGLIQLRVNQIVRRLEFHQHRQTSFRRRVVPRVRGKIGNVGSRLYSVPRSVSRKLNAGR